MGDPKKVDSWDEEVTDKPAMKVDTWDEDVVDSPVKKKEPTSVNLSPATSSNVSQTVAEPSIKNGLIL